MRVLIFANGDIADYDFVRGYMLPEDMVVCCDGGTRHTKAMGCMPNFIIGDFDSADQDVIAYYREKKVPFIPFPVEKDYTDLELCINFVLNRNADEILIFGGIGSRFDHTLTNAHILKLALDKKVKATLLNESNRIQLMEDMLELKGTIGDTLSLIPLTTEVRGVVTKGLKYPLSNEVLYIGSSRGVSNVFEEEDVCIKIKSGLLFVIQAWG